MRWWPLIRTSCQLSVTIIGRLACLWNVVAKCVSKFRELRSAPFITLRQPTLRFICFNFFLKKNILIIEGIIVRQFLPLLLLPLVQQFYDQLQDVYPTHYLFQLLCDRIHLYWIVSLMRQALFHSATCVVPGCMCIGQSTPSCYAMTLSHGGYH